MTGRGGDTAALAADGVTAGYGERMVLRAVPLEVWPGELLAVVGPNGAGKSTIVKVLAGQLRPWSGRVELFGRPIASLTPRELARSVATVGQENAVAFRFTVLEIVLMGRAPHLGRLAFEGRRDLEIAWDALARLDLLDLAGRHIQELSGGERRRVFLARALAQEPRVALLDEPTAFLDLRHAAEIFTRFKELALERKMAVVATLHDLNMAALYADRVLLMKDGAAIGQGAPEEVLTNANLRAVYETELYVGKNPLTGTIAVLPVTRLTPDG